MRLFPLCALALVFTSCVSLDGGCERHDAKTKLYSRVLVGAAGTTDATAKRKLEEEIALVLEQKLRIYAVPESRLYSKPYVLEGPARSALLAENALEATLRVRPDPAAPDRLTFEVIEKDATEPAWRVDALFASPEKVREDAIQAALGAKLKTVAACDPGPSPARTRYWGDYSPGDF